MPKLLKISLALILAYGLQFTVYSFNCYAQDKIVAVVNNEVITQKDLDEFTNFMRMQLSRDHNQPEVEKKLESLKTDFLQKLIEDRLILQEAKNSKVNIDESRIKTRLAEIKKRYPSDADFQEDLIRQGLTRADMENKIREQLLMYYIINQKVRSLVSVRPDEVTHFYNSDPKKFSIGEERELEMINLENKDQAVSFSYNLKSGEKLEQLAARYPVSVDQIKASRNGQLMKDIEE
jgi:parvulin-like peptidyl-prolyl isomerase